MASSLIGFFLDSRIPGKNGFNVVGYSGTKVPEQYIITIVSTTSKVAIRAVLQDKFSIKTGSRWQTFIDAIRSNPIVEAGEFGAQAFFGKSLQNAMMSRRIWRGTDPLTLSLHLKFEEEYSSKSEVVDPCRYLQQITLPGESVDLGNLLIPPGPSPFKIGNEQSVQLSQASDLISVYVGRFLSFRNVIVKDVTTTYSNRYGSDGNPKSAEVEIVFETYEIVTKPRMDLIYSKPDVFDKYKYGSSKNEVLNSIGGSRIFDVTGANV